MDIDIVGWHFFPHLLINHLPDKLLFVFPGLSVTEPKLLVIIRVCTAAFSDQSLYWTAVVGA